MIYLPLLAFVSLWSSTTGLKRSPAVTHTPRPMKRPVSRTERTGLPPPYLHLPVHVQSRVPLVEKERFRPSVGTGLEPVPEAVRDVLLPQSPDPSPSPDPDPFVRVECKQRKMVVEVQRRALGGGEPRAMLRLGSCQVTNFTKHHLYFDYDLDQCGTEQTIIDNHVAYVNTLYYNPVRTEGPIRRAAPFSLPVSCYYNRYHYSYKIGYKPKLQMHRIFKQMRHRVKFSLTPRNAQWERLSRSDTYTLGKPMYFQAEAQFVSPDERLYVHSCYVTPDQRHTSMHQFPVVMHFGCMTESRVSHSRFIPYKNDAVRFTVDAFLFEGLAGELYMHCTMSVSSSTPTPTSKSCNYDQKKGRWVELYGLDSVCSCCDSNCSSDASTVTNMISSRAWKVKSKVKPTTTQKRKTVSTTTTTTKTTTISRQLNKRTTTLRPETKVTTLKVKVEEPGNVLEWPFGGNGVTWVEAEGEERQVKGSAVVEEEEEEELAKPRLVFEDIFNFDK
ncbi:zona pellucida sperm-binding protein 3d.2 isoform X2 [Sphaeramia orbicularis]|uniref:zona pellucida sperm-binding protein 3d.2 isoform X2 n=1 Tax=Sphaeramia orbicularis TaxID=375764 RepID=UPI00117CF868|nr:zona pellucida sperm-binding protein 3-like isoform X2 [Sphaeramia orbicularis]